MAELFHDLRWIHIAVGTIAIILFWIPVAASKGGRLHVRIGWIYALCMAVVVLTAFGMTGMLYAAPLGVRQASPALTAEQALQLIRASRQTAFFLAYLGAVTLAAGWQGISVLRTRPAPKLLRTPFAFGLNAAVILAALGSLALGLYSRNAIFGSMSVVGFLVGGGNLAYLLRGPATRSDWLYQHLSSMIGTGIAGYTAFIAFGGRHLLGPLVSPRYYVLFWLLPTVIGTPAIALTIAYCKRKRGDAARIPKPEALPALAFGKTEARR
jgi:hypothetical protein